MKCSRVFITVGTTDFDTFIEQIDVVQFCDALSTLSCTELVVQIGRGKKEPIVLPDACTQRGISYECFRFKPTLSENMSRADLIISHCGAGSVLEALTLQKMLVVVVNPTLQGNHQTELADTLTESKYALSSEPHSFLEDFARFTSEGISNMLETYPQTDLNTFPDLVDSLFEWET